MMSPTIDVKEAAALAGIGLDAMKASLIQGKVPYGYAVQVGSKSHRYIVYRNRLMAYINADDMTGGAAT